MVAVPCLRRYESMTLVKAGKTFLNGPGRRGKEQTEKLLLPQKSKAGGSNRGKCSRSREKTAGGLRGYL